MQSENSETPVLQNEDEIIDRRKYDVGEYVQAVVEPGKDPIIAEVAGVRYSEDADGIRHNYEYIISVPELAEDAGLVEQNFDITSGHVVKKVSAGDAPKELVDGLQEARKAAAASPIEAIDDQIPEEEVSTPLDEALKENGK